MTLKFVSDDHEASSYRYLSMFIFCQIFICKDVFHEHIRLGLLYSVCLALSVFYSCHVKSSSQFPLKSTTLPFQYFQDLVPTFCEEMTLTWKPCHQEQCGRSCTRALQPCPYPAVWEASQPPTWKDFPAWLINQSPSPQLLKTQEGSSKDSLRGRRLV